MEKSHTLLLIQNNEEKKSEYKNILNNFFSTIVEASDEKKALSAYVHYRPDAIILGSEVLNDYYQQFLTKIKKNLSTPIIIMIEPHEMQSLYKVFDYNFAYCILDEDYEENLTSCLEQTVQKINLVKQLIEIDSFGKLKNLQKYENSMNRTSVPTILCTGNLDNVKSNKAFSDYFGVSQDEINHNVMTQDFLNRLELKEIIQHKDLTKEHQIVINKKELTSKIYILRQYELYLITFNSMANENQVINMDLKKELEQILCRIDHNFDDHIKLQYNMIEITSQIRSFLQTDTEDQEIHEWLENNKNAVQSIQREFDYAILEELKMHTYLNAS